MLSLHLFNFNFVLLSNDWSWYRNKMRIIFLEST